MNKNYVIIFGDMKKVLPILVLELNLIKSAFVGSVDVEENMQFNKQNHKI